MGGILWVLYLIQRQVGGDDQRFPAAVSAVYDVVDLFQCVLGATLHAEVVNDEQGIAAEPVHNIIAPGKAGTTERIDWISLKGSLIKSLVHAVQLQGNGAAY